MSLLILVFFGLQSQATEKCVSALEAKAILLTQVNSPRYKEELDFLLEREESELGLIKFLDNIQFYGDSQIYQARFEYSRRADDAKVGIQGSVLGHVKCDGSASIIVSPEHD